MAAEHDPLVALWLRSQQLRPNTLNSYRGDLELFTAWCRERHLALVDVNADDLARYGSHLNETYSNPKTANAHRANVRRFYKWLFLNGKLASNPADNGASLASRARGLDLDQLVAVWLGSKHLRPNSMRAYQGNLNLFTAWCRGLGLDLADVTADDLARYALHLNQTHTNLRTAHARRADVRRFYTWLFDNGKIAANPADKVEPAVDRAAALIPTLSVAEVRSLIAVAEEPMDRAALLMTAVLGMPIREIKAAQVGDLVEDQGDWSLNIPSRPGTLPLPDFVALALARAAGDRRRGPLVLNKRGNGLTRANQTVILNRLAAAANLGVEVSPGMLVASLRSEMLAMAPAVTIYQGLGFGTDRNLLLRAKAARPAKPHLTYLAASLFRPDANTTDALLDAAEAISSGSDRLPVAARVAVAGSAFERHLRELAYARKLLDPAEAKPTNIGLLQGILRGAGVFSNEEVQACATVQDVRDWAAHGWYERVTDEVADRAIAIMRRITRAHPIGP